VEGEAVGVDVMVHHGARFVHQLAVGREREQAAGEVEILGFGAQPADRENGRAPRGHAGADHAQHRAGLLRQPLVGTAEDPVELVGQPARTGPTVDGQRAAGDPDDGGIGVRAEQVLEPVGLGDRVVVEEHDDLAAGELNALGPFGADARTVAGVLDPLLPPRAVVVGRALLDADGRHDAGQLGPALAKARGEIGVAFHADDDLPRRQVLAAHRFHRGAGQLPAIHREREDDHRRVGNAAGVRLRREPFLMLDRHVRTKATSGKRL